MLTRLSHSHIRIGTFQRFAAFGDAMRIERLLAHSVRHYLPQAARPTTGDEAAAFLGEVCENVGRLCAQWMVAGFVHGVLNTDNIVITGESFDYGPYRFLPNYDPGFTAAYFDETGLYAYGRQPNAVLWNLYRLAETLSLVAPVEKLKEALSRFDDAFTGHLGACVTWRLGLTPRSESKDGDARRQALSVSQSRERALRASDVRLARRARPERRRRSRGRRAPSIEAKPSKASSTRSAIMSLHPPRPTAEAYFSGERPITLLYDEIEALWAAIAERDDWSGFEAKLAAIDRVREAYGVP